jgi:spore coat polysaccharide biosynthesis protein SpsF|tara:strand:+ start:37 stop:777 length:741 start_codon:yes stop_codon:yes gene_type:complete
MKIKKIIGIILVRSDSKRLPNKCFLDFGEVTILHHIIKRCLHYKITPIICTTLLKSDDKVVNLAKRLNILYYRGSTKNKILRISNCCKKFKLEMFHTIDADDPFFCGKEIRRSIQYLNSLSLDIVRPTLVSSKGSALVGYSAKSNIFHKLSQKIYENTNTEMMWNFFKKLKNIKIKTLSKSKFDCNARLTLDYPEDYIFLESIRLILGNLTSRKNICNLLKKNPNLVKINYFRNIQWKNNQNKKQN